LNFTESGSDNTGDFTFSPSFSLGMPGEGYLVTTTQVITGNVNTDEITAGGLNVEGAENTQLCMEINPPNVMTVTRDEGLGDGCSIDVPPPFLL